MRGNDYTCAKIERRDYIILKLFSGDGFSMSEFCSLYGITDRTGRRALAAVRDSIYAIFEENAQVIYDRKIKKYFLIIYKSIFNIANLPLV